MHQSSLHPSRTQRLLLLAAWPLAIAGVADADAPATRPQLPPPMQPDTRPSKAQLSELLEGLSSPVPDERRNAAAALQKLGSNAEPARSALFTAIGDEAPAVQVAAADAWVASWGREPEAVAGLLPALKDDRGVLRSSAAAQLAQIGEKDAARIIPELIPLLEDHDELTRARAASAIGTLAESAPEQAAKAVPPLLAALSDVKDKLAWEKRFEAARTLLRMGPAARVAAPQILQALRTPDAIPHLRERLIPLLPRVVDTPQDLLPLLAELKQDENPDVAAAAAKLMQQIQSAAPATRPS